MANPANPDREARNLAAALEADRVAFEQAGSPAPRAVLAAGYLRATHPDTGDQVTFVPGEALPDWAADKVRAGAGVLDPETGAFDLDAKPRTRRSGAVEPAKAVQT